MKFFNRILYILLLISVYGWSMCAAQEAGGAAVAEDDVARQLRIYEESLVRGTSQQSRHDSAIELLRRGDNAAWEVLLKAILLKENPDARRAVCFAIIESKSWGKDFRSRAPFINPLIGILVDEGGNDAKLAGEALLAFKFDEISKRVGSLARTTSLDRRIRLNAVYALSLWPDKGAVLELVNLLDDPDVEVSSAVEELLPYWIARGKNKEIILLELQRMSPDEIFRAQLGGLHFELSKLKADRDVWKKLYLASVDKDYAKSSDESKGKILVAGLESDLAAVRLWAVGKVASFSGARPEGFREKLLALISDPERSIRLATANVLANMSSLDPGEKLLAQLKAERYTDVRLAIFDALGEACFFAFSPGSQIKLDESVRTETLETAAVYLVSPDGATAAKGAEVMGKLLELNGLARDRSQEYLKLLAKRYEQSKKSPGALRGALLNVMARLCSQGEYQQLSTEWFGSFFIEGLAVKDDLAVREAAAAGLVSIDKVVAFRLFKENGFANDSSTLVRRTVIRLAGELGKPDDLVWLVERINSNGESDVAWKAMREILLRAKAAEVFAWGRKLSEGDDKSEHGIELLEMAEKKAEVEENISVLTEAQKKLLALYAKKGDYAQVIAYCGKLLESAKDPVDIDSLKQTQLYSYLMSGDNANAVQMVSVRLGKKDIGADDGFVIVIGDYLALGEVPAATRAEAVVKLAAIKHPQGRTQWVAQIKAWQQPVKPK